jgi:hypothetical protein
MLAIFNDLCSTVIVTTVKSCSSAAIDCKPRYHPSGAAQARRAAHTQAWENRRVARVRAVEVVCATFHEDGLLRTVFP